MQLLGLRPPGFLSPPRSRVVVWAGRDRDRSAPCPWRCNHPARTRSLLRLIRARVRTIGFRPPYSRSGRMPPLQAADLAHLTRLRQLPGEGGGWGGGGFEL